MLDFFLVATQQTLLVMSSERDLVGSLGRYRPTRLPSSITRLFRQRVTVLVNLVIHSQHTARRRRVIGARNRSERDRQKLT